MNFKDHIEHLKTFFTPSVKNVILLIRWLITAAFTGRSRGKYLYMTLPGAYDLCLHDA